MENLFIMKKIKKYSDHLKEVIRKMRENNRIRTNAESLVLEVKKIVAQKKDQITILCSLKETHLIDEEDFIVPWYKFNSYKERVERELGMLVEPEDGLEASISFAKIICEREEIDPSLDDQIMEIDPEDII
ncbi:MAG TPA: hypothetical protein PLV35_01225 [Candidatus Paceibacterota bacterium]|nr:hypothetical protein [Candidatus Paceibacterota bacterium]